MIFIVDFPMFLLVPTIHSLAIIGIFELWQMFGDGWAVHTVISLDACPQTEFFGNMLAYRSIPFLDTSRNRDQEVLC